MENIYNAIQNVYNMDKTTWQEVLAELYNLFSNVENKFDLFEDKFGMLLGEEVTRELKKMYNDGSLALLINDVLLKDINTKVDAFKTDVSEQLDTKANEIDLKIERNRIDKLLKIGEVEFIQPTINNYLYINENGEIKEGNTFMYTSPILVNRGEIINAYTRGYRGSVSAISKCDADGNNIKPLVLDNTTTNYNVYSYVAEEDIYVTISGKIVDTFIYKTKHKKPSISDTIFNTINYFPMFSKGVCIGDSLTKGHYEEYTDIKNREYTYPLALSRITNVPIDNLGISGATCTSWFNSQYINTDFSQYDFAIICFGRNGALATDDEKNNYKNIINKIKTDSPNCIIFLCDVPPGNKNNEAERNLIIKNIAKETNCHYLNINTVTIMTYDKGSLYRPTDGIHFNKIGYTTMAYERFNFINFYIHNNLEKFKNLYVGPATS